MIDRNPEKLTAMHHLHLASGAKMVDDTGWQRPARYAGLDEELEWLRSSVGICDISPVAKTSVQGDALETTHPDLGELAVGHASRKTIAEATDPVVLARLASDEAMVIAGPGTGPAITEALSRHDDTCVHAVDVTSGMTGVSVVGPSASLVLASATDFDISDAGFPNMSCAQGRFSEIYALFLRLDRGSLSGYELYFGRDFGEYIWEALVESAHHHGGGPVGTEAMKRVNSAQ